MRARSARDSLSLPRAPALLPIASVIVGASAGASSGCGDAAGSDHGARWWGSDYEFFHFECYVVVALVWLAMVFDALHHKMMRSAKEAHLLKFDDPHQHEVHRDFEVPLWENLANRCSGELMVLGFLAFVVWFCNRADFFERIAVSLRGYSTIALPSAGYDYLHAVEDVHMHLFLAMFMYVGLCSLIVRGTVWAEVQWAAKNACIVAAHAGGHVDSKWIERQNGSIREFALARVEFLDSLEMGRSFSEPVKEMLGPVLARLSRSWHLRITRSSALSRPPGQDWQDAEEGGEDVLRKSSRRHVRELLDPWFPFNQYLALQCRFLIDNLVEIKSTTWAFLSLVMLVKAQILRESKSTWLASLPSWVILCAFASTSCLAAWKIMRIRGSLQRSTRSGTERAAFSSSMSLSRQSNHLSQVVNSLETHRQYPWVTAVRLLQMTLFALCYFVARYVASRHSWETVGQNVVPIAACIMCVFGLPFLGLALGKFLPRVSLLLARAEFMQEHHLHWMRVILEDHEKGRDKLLCPSSRVSFSDELVDVSEVACGLLGRSFLEKDGCSKVLPIKRDLPLDFFDAISPIGHAPPDPPGVVDVF